MWWQYNGDTSNFVYETIEFIYENFSGLVISTTVMLVSHLGYMMWHCWTFFGVEAKVSLKINVRSVPVINDEIIKLK